MDYSHDPREEHTCQKAQHVMPPMFHRYCLGDPDSTDKDLETYCNELRSMLHASIHGDCPVFWGNRRSLASILQDMGRKVGYSGDIDAEIRDTQRNLSAFSPVGKCSSR